jgi:hypothetical protein
MERETGSLHLLASLLLTGGKGADLVIRGNVVLNKKHERKKNEEKKKELTFGNWDPNRSEMEMDLLQTL